MLQLKCYLKMVHYLLSVSKIDGTTIDDGED